MEVSSALHRGTRQALTQPSRWHLTSRTKFISNPPRQQATRTSIRTFTSTPQPQQQQSPPPQTSNEPSTDTTTAQQARPQTKIPSPDPAKRIDLSSLPGIPSSYKPPGYAQRNTSSASEQLDALFGRASRPSPTPGKDNPFERTIRQTNALNRSSPSSNSQWDGSTLNISSILENLPGTRDSPGKILDSKQPLRLRPTLGRTVPVDNNRGVDVARAFRQMEMKCSKNKVKTDSMAQRFHVRRGQARKLARSLRWRVQFKAGFLEECARIRRMKKQGW